VKEMPKLTKAEAVQILESAKQQLDAANNREDLMETLRQAGKKVGYAPASRCLVIGHEPADSIQWS
jgi:hypothetical protein